MNVKLVAFTQGVDGAGPESIAATGARLCYAPSGKTLGEQVKFISSEDDKKYLEKLVDLGHLSPLEHASYTFLIEGVSRSLLAQITRHRIASYSVQSQRYVNMLDGCEFVIPEPIEKAPGALTEFNNTMYDLLESYKKIYILLMLHMLRVEFPHIFRSTNTLSTLASYDDHLNKINTIIDQVEDESLKTEIMIYFNKADKIAAENARAVLPNAAPTNIMMTMNARALMNFFNERCCRRAQLEIRQLAWEMLTIVKDTSPNIFTSAGPECMRTKCKEGKMSCGYPYAHDYIYKKDGE